MKAAAHQPTPSSRTVSPLPTDANLQLTVEEDDMDVDEELVLDPVSSDDERAPRHDRRKPAGKQRIRFSLRDLGRKHKGKYSEVTATHEARLAPPGGAHQLRALHTAEPSTAESSDTPATHSLRSTPLPFASAPSTLAGVQSCVTAFNCVLCVVLCGVIVLSGWVGWIIGHRGASAYSAPLPRLLVLSLDGFRSSYLQEYAALTPNLHRILSTGLSAGRLTPVFPSSTFPNHWSLVTGLYPPQHGIIANRMYNATSGEWFIVGQTSNDSLWWDGEPVWLTAQKWGLSTAVLNWPGSDVEGMRPNVWAEYDGSIADDARVDTLLGWLDAGRCVLCMVYISTVDQAGHQFGPNSTGVADAVASVDATVGRLLNGLTSRGLLGAVNVLVVSDHGMTGVATNGSTRWLFVDDFYTATDYVLVETQANAHLLPLDNATAPLLFNSLKNNMPHVTVSWSWELPASLHYSDNALIQPILVMAGRRRGSSAPRASMARPSLLAHVSSPLSPMCALLPCRPLCLLRRRGVDGDQPLLRLRRAGGAWLHAAAGGHGRSAASQRPGSAQRCGG